MHANAVDACLLLMGGLIIDVVVLILQDQSQLVQVYLTLLFLLTNLNTIL